MRISVCHRVILCALPVELFVVLDVLDVQPATLTISTERTPSIKTIFNVIFVIFSFFQLRRAHSNSYRAMLNAVNRTLTHAKPRLTYPTAAAITAISVEESALV
jgi:hypothetical protein